MEVGNDNAKGDITKCLLSLKSLEWSGILVSMTEILSLHHPSLNKYHPMWMASQIIGQISKASA